MPTIKLQTSDDEIFKCDLEVAKYSGTIRTLLEHLKVEENTVIPLLNITSTILPLVLEYCDHLYQADSDPARLNIDDDSDEDENDDQNEDSDEEENQGKYKVEKPVKEVVIEPWEALFLQVDQEILLDLVCAASYLNIPRLITISCKTVANMIKEKSPEELRKTFNIPNDFTEAEEEQVRRENTWCVFK